MFYNRMLGRIFGPKRDEITKERKKLHNEELNDLYSQPNIFRVIKSKRTRCDGVFSTYEASYRCVQVLMVESEGRDHLGDPGVDGRIILRWLSKKWEKGPRTGLLWLRVGTGGGILSKRGKEPSGSMKYEEILY